MATTLASETWTGTDGAAWPEQWTTTALGGTIDIQSNKGRMVSAGDGPLALLGGVSAADVDVTATITMPTATGSVIFLSARVNGLTGNTPTNGYSLLLWGNTDYQFRRTVGGSSTDIFPAASAPGLVGLAPGALAKMRYQVVGSTHRVKLWDGTLGEPGTWTNTFTDATYSTAGGVSLSLFSASTWLIDDLTVLTVDPQISLRAAGATLAATVAVTAINPLVPAGATTGDLSVLGFGGKPFGITPTTPTNWTKIGEATNGTVANSAADLGSTKVAVYTRVGAPVGAIGAMTVGGTPDTLDAVINTYAKDPTYTWDAVPWTTGVDNTNGANFAATGSSWAGIAAGDWVVAVCSVNGDVGTPTAITIGGMAGATLGTTVTRTNHAVTTGFDNRLIVADVPITAGSSTAAPTFAYTNASSTSGTVLWLRLRQIAPAVAVAPAPIMFLQAINRAADW